MFAKWKRHHGNFDYIGFFEYKNKKYLVHDVRDFGRELIHKVEYYSDNPDWLLEWHNDINKAGNSIEIDYWKNHKLHWAIVKAFNKLPLTHEIVFVETNHGYNGIKYDKLQNTKFIRI